MMNLRNCILVALLSSAQARKLSFTMIAGFEPESNVNDHVRKILLLFLN